MSNNTGYKLHVKTTAIVLVYAMCFQLFYPSISLAHTGGPGQAENKSFMPAGVTDNVSLFTGDFMYNIPLLDIGGYPIALSYNGNIGMHSESSWVGLGWSCSPGFINREKRGLPDDMKGDLVRQKVQYKPDVTNSLPVEVGFGTQTGVGVLGVNWSWNKEFGFGLFQNTYTGLGYESHRTKGNSVGAMGMMSYGSGKTTVYNSETGFSLYDSDYSRNKERFSIFFDDVTVTNKSRTNVYNSRAGFTEKLIGGGKGKEANWGIVGMLIETVVQAIWGGEYYFARIHHKYHE